MIAERVTIECSACLSTFDTTLTTGETAQRGRFIEMARHGCPECGRIYRRQWARDDAPVRHIDMPSEEAE